MPRAYRRVGARPQLDRPCRLIGDPERRTARIGQPHGSGGDLPKDLVGIERRGDELYELDQGPQLARQGFGGVDARAIHYPKLRRRLALTRARQEARCASHPDRSTRQAVPMIARSRTATPSGTVVAGTRGCPPGLAAAEAGTSHVGNGMSSPPAGEDFGAVWGGPARASVRARQIKSPARTQAACPAGLTPPRSRWRRP